jgi:RimJ/RimL family protein N-acetyltransferase
MEVRRRVACLCIAALGVNVLYCRDPHLGWACPRRGYAGGVGCRFDVVQTARLVMRRWRDDDRAAFAVMNADPVVMRYFPATLGRAASDALIDRIEDLFDRRGSACGRWRWPGPVISSSSLA